MQLSESTGAAKEKCAPHAFNSALMVVSDEQETMVGGVLSITVTTRSQVATLPNASVAWKRNGVGPMGKKEPLARPLMSKGEALLQLSVAMGSA
jgi:hypothetical protein